MPLPGDPRVVGALLKVKTVLLRPMRCFICRREGAAHLEELVGERAAIPTTVHGLSRDDPELNGIEWLTEDVA